MLVASGDCGSVCEHIGLHIYPWAVVEILNMSNSFSIFKRLRKEFIFFSLNFKVGAGVVART